MAVKNEEQRRYEYSNTYFPLRALEVHGEFEPRYRLYGTNECVRNTWTECWNEISLSNRINRVCWGTGWVWDLWVQRISDKEELEIKAKSGPHMGANPWDLHGEYADTGFLHLLNFP